MQIILEQKGNDMLGSRKAKFQREVIFAAYFSDGQNRKRWMRDLRQIVGLCTTTLTVEKSEKTRVVSYSIKTLIPLVYTQKKSKYFRKSRN